MICGWKQKEENMMITLMSIFLGLAVMRIVLCIVWWLIVLPFRIIGTLASPFGHRHWHHHFGPRHMFWY